MAAYLNKQHNHNQEHVQFVVLSKIKCNAF